MKLSFRLLTTDEELGCFISRSGNQTTPAYLKSCRAVGAFWGSEIVGGWAFSYPIAGADKAINDLIEQGLLSEIREVWFDQSKVDPKQAACFSQKIYDDARLNCALNILWKAMSPRPFPRAHLKPSLILSHVQYLNVPYRSS